MIPTPTSTPHEQQTAPSSNPNPNPNPNPLQCLYVRHPSDLPLIEAILFSPPSHNSLYTYENDDEAEHIAHTLLRIPQRVSNLCHTHDILLPKWAAPPNVYYRKLLQCLNFASSGLFVNRVCGKQKKNNASVLKCVLYDLVWVRNDVSSTAYVLMMMDDDDPIQCQNDKKERNPRNNGNCAVRVACTELYRVHKSSRTLVKLLVACMDLVLDPGDGDGVSWKVAVQRLYDVFCSMLEMLGAGTLEEVESSCKYMIQYVLLRQRKKQGNEAVVGSSTKIDDPPLFSHACALHWLLGKVKVVDSQPSGTDAYKRLPLLQHAFQYAAKQWHSNAFIRYSCPAFQRNLTAFILRYLEQADASSSDDSVSSAQINANHDVSALLVRGISHRLHSIDDSIRRDGMFVAELLAKITLTKEQQQSNVVSFDELLDVPRWGFSNFDCDDTIADDLQKDSDKNYEEIEDEAMFSSSAMKSGKSTSCKSSSKNNFLIIDPDQAYHSSSDEDSHSDRSSCSLSSSSDSDSFDETDLHSFQGEDDVEDLRTVPKPLYLRQCLLMLRESSTNENDECAYAKMETALIELPLLLERRRRQLTDDLRDVCQLLCKELMNVENKYNIEHFDALRFKSLVQLIVSEPILSARCLLDDILFEEGGITLGRRIELLNVLMCAAKELSGVGQDQTDVGKLENCNTDKLVKEQAGKVIRRRRIRKREASNSHSSNKFAPHAVFFVFSLLRGFAHTKENRSIWDNGDDDGCQMIGTFLYTLGTLIECSGKGLSTPKLAVEVFQFSLLFRLADRPHVRQAVLYSLYICIQHVDEEFLFDVVHSNFDIVRYLTHSSSSDPNEKCRQLALMIASEVKDIIDSSAFGLIMRN